MRKSDMWSDEIPGDRMQWYFRNKKHDRDLKYLKLKEWIRKTMGSGKKWHTGYWNMRRIPRCLVKISQTAGSRNWRRSMYKWPWASGCFHVLLWLQEKRHVRLKRSSPVLAKFWTFKRWKDKRYEIHMGETKSTEHAFENDGAQSENAL